MSESKIYLSGLPYGPDVRKLTEAYPVGSLTEGRIISHEELEVVLREARGSSRYYGVANSWRSKQRNECGILLEWEQSKGLKVLDPAEFFGHTEKGIRQAARLVNRKIRHLRWVDRTRLDETGQKRYDHSVMEAAKIKHALDGGVRNMAVELAPVKSLPKPSLVKRAS